MIGCDEFEELKSFQNVLVVNQPCKNLLTTIVVNTTICLADLDAANEVGTVWINHDPYTFIMTQFR